MDGVCTSAAALGRRYEGFSVLGPGEVYFIFGGHRKRLRREHIDAGAFCRPDLVIRCCESELEPRGGLSLGQKRHQRGSCNDHTEPTAPPCSPHAWESWQKQPGMIFSFCKPRNFWLWEELWAGNSLKSKSAKESAQITVSQETFLGYWDNHSTHAGGVWLVPWVLPPCTRLGPHNHVPTKALQEQPLAPGQPCQNWAHEASGLQYRRESTATLCMASKDDTGEAC